MTGVSTDTLVPDLGGGVVAVIAVDCGGTNLAVAHVRRATRPEPPVVVPTPPSATEIPGRIVDLMAELPPVEAIGVGVAGLVDHETGRLLWMPHRPGGASIADELRSATGLPIFVDNDANVTALAEAAAGAGAGYHMVLAVTVGTGIGGGLVIDGAIERGRGHLGEVGHMSVDPAGPLCVCGRVGCWEEIGSGRALDRKALERGLRDGSALVAASAAGDAAAAAALAEVGRAFGDGLANLVAAFDPDVVVVGGGVAAAGDAFLDPARLALVSAVSGSAHRRATPVVGAAFGSAAGIVGAALIAGAPL